MNSTKISVLVPVYNVEQYIQECLNSILGQTLDDIEVILVDDGSTDGSGAICDDYAKRDKRIQVVHKPENEGLLLARKTAVSKAGGIYTVFVDSDDFLSNPDSLQMMYDAIRSEQVDILQFAIEFLQPDGKKTLATSGFHRVYAENLDNSLDIISACIDGKYGWNLWNKIFRTSVCRKAYLSIKDVRVITAEDCYAYFLIAFYAQSFKGIQTLPLYTYRQGSGVTKRVDVGLDRFEMFCRENLIVKWLKKFLKKQSISNKRKAVYKSVLENLSNRFFNHCVWRYQQLSESDKPTGRRMLLKYFNTK